MPELKDGKLKLVFPNEVTKTGKLRTHDATYLLAHMAPDDAMVLAKHMEDYCSPYSPPTTPACLVSRVLVHWPASFPMFPTDATSLFQAIKELRTNWYGRANPRLPEAERISLGTANKEWARFIPFLEYMSRNGLPAINYQALGANPTWDSSTLKQAAKTVTDLQRLNVLRGHTADADYTDALVVPLSIHLSDEAYLDKYEHDLQEAMDAIYKAAVQDLEAFIQMEEDGQKMLDKVRPKYAKVLERVETVGKRLNWYGDPEHNLISIFDPKHPDYFAYKLALVDMEMGGIPKSWFRNILDPEQSRPGEKRTYRKVCDPSTPSRWKYMREGIPTQDYHKLLGHLGIMSIEAMVACLAIIHIENPSINVMSLQRAELEDADGHSILLANVGEDDAQRLIVGKPRAETQKSVILRGKSLDAMQCILRWTARCRQALKDAGDPNANKLLLCVNRHNKVSFAAENVGKAFGLNKGSLKFLSFVERHSELSAWAPRITMATLRVSAGVLAWFKSGGDEEATRRAFGHATAATSLRNYIPLPLQEAMNIRRVRRFQNLLICAACAGEAYLLEATDFLDLAELHEFLSQMLTGNGMDAGNDLLETLRKSYENRDASAAANSTLVAPVSLDDHETVYLALTIDGLAILRLYRDRLLAPDITARMLDTPDQRTGTKPRLWLDLGNAFEQHDASIIARYPEYRAVIEQAATRAEELRGKVRFPDLTAV